MKIYIRICFTIAILITLLGFVCPFLISENDNLSVIFGFLLLFTIPPFLYFEAMAIFNNSKRRLNNEKDK